MSEVHPDPMGGGPRVDGQHPDILPGSPLALIGVFVDIARARFRGENIGIPWTWREDPTVLETDENTPEAPSLIYIESAYTEDPDARNRLPAIFVDRDDMTLMKGDVGHRAAIHQPTRTEAFRAYASVPMVFECAAQKRGESSNIGYFLWEYLSASTFIIREFCSVHDITPPVLGKTNVQRRLSSNIEAWVTPVTTTLLVKYMWVTKPIAPVLQEIAARWNFGPGVEIGSTQRSTRR